MAELTYRDSVAAGIAQEEMARDDSVSLPLVIRTANGAGLRFGAQHSQSVENWAMAIPGFKVIAPSTAADVKGLLAAAVRDPDPVVFFEHKSLYPTKGEVPDGEHVDELGTARVRCEGTDLTIAALAAMVPRAMEAAGRLQIEGEEGDSLEIRPAGYWRRVSTTARSMGRIQGRSCSGSRRYSRPQTGRASSFKAGSATMEQE